MKKLIALLLTFVMLIALCACGSTAAPANDPGLTENTTSAESVVWKISCVDAEGSDYMKAFTAMWERIEKETNGYIDGRVPLVAMISDCSTANVLELARRSKEAGATEAMLTPPYFSHLNQRAIKAFFTEVADKIDIPLWIYHQPGETKLTVALEDLVELAKHPNIIGVKIAPAEDFLYFTQAVRLLKDNDSFSLLNGEDFDLMASMLIGGDGGVSSLGNIIPNEVINLFNAAQQGDWVTARAMHEVLMDAFDAVVDVSTGNYQSAVKTVLMAQGIYSTNVISSPFLTILPEEQETVLAKARAAGIIK